jgi:catechol 2,3-dioxygenase
MALSSSTANAAIHPDTTVGTVRLTVSDLDRSRAFYEQAVGLQATELEYGALALGTGAGRALIELREDRAAPVPGPRANGLYHVAILVPTRRDLASALARLAQAGWPSHGASDHLVSEALYSSDPDGNGIEIYRDRPRDQWPRAGDTLQMSTLPLDLRSLLGELGDAPSERLVPAGSPIGHIHLQVADLRQAEAFYSGVLGFEVMVRTYPGALFLAAGRYHHHIGLNTWHSAGACPPPPGSIGLRSFELELPDEQELRRVLESVQAAGIEIEQTDSGSLVRDPSGNAVVLGVPSAAQARSAGTER